MASLLDGHPEIVAYPEETMFFRRFLPAIQNASYQEKLNLAEKLLINIFEWNLENPPEHQKNYPDRDYSEISYNAVSEEMIRNIVPSSENPADFLNAVMLSFGKVTGLLTDVSKHWLEKTPYNELHTKEIFSWWSNPKCIHIVRDPRGNFYSYERKHADWSARRFGKNWVRSTNAGLRNVKTFGKNRYLMVRFGDLLKNPAEKMAEVADFLDIRMTEILLKPTRMNEFWHGNSMFNETYQSISKAPLTRWEGHLDIYDQMMIEAICGRLMKELDFKTSSLDSRGLKFAQRLNIWREKLIAGIK